MHEQRLQFIDELTRAEAKNAREARRAAPTANPLCKTTPLMAYVRSFLPPDISNAALCKRLQLSDSTRRRLEKGESVPDVSTLQHLGEKLSLTPEQFRRLRVYAYVLHTRFGAVMRACLRLEIFDPVYVNGMLARYLDAPETLYSTEDVEKYDAFTGDWRDWRIMCKYHKKPISKAEERLKESLDHCSFEVTDPSPLVRRIVSYLRPPMRPGHFYRLCTLKKGTWENLNTPKVLPSEKTLWKIIVGLRLDVRESGRLLYLAYSDIWKDLDKEHTL